MTKQPRIQPYELNRPIRLPANCGGIVISAIDDNQVSRWLAHLLAQRLERRAARHRHIPVILDLGLYQPSDPDWLPPFEPPPTLSAAEQRPISVILLCSAQCSAPQIAAATQHLGRWFSTPDRPARLEMRLFTRL
ncbi:MAG: hypothetical protein ACON4F_00475 [Candidatus Puniceispirillaceae bacterium]